jgi:hypothetical protein
MAQEESYFTIPIAVLNRMFSEPWGFWILLESFASNTRNPHDKENKENWFQKT